MIARLLAWLRRPGDEAARHPKHRHEWTYTGPTGTGWLIARCDCGAWDIAS